LITKNDDTKEAIKKQIRDNLLGDKAVKKDTTDKVTDNKRKLELLLKK
jgi:hypothetical protein